MTGSLIRLKIKVNNIYDHDYSIIYYDYTETTVNVVPVKDNSQSIALESNGAWSRVDANGNHVAAGSIDIHSFMWMQGENDELYITNNEIIEIGEPLPESEPVVEVPEETTTAPVTESIEETAETTAVS